MTILNMQDPLVSRGARLAALKSVVRLAKVGLKTRGVTPTKSAKMLGYTGPASLDKIAAWVESEMTLNLMEMDLRNG